MAAWFGFVSMACAIEVGDIWAAPPPDLGKPSGRIVAGGRTFYRWPELEVTVVAGRVTQVRKLDAASLAAEKAERGKADAEARARLAAERKAIRPSEDEAVARPGAASIPADANLPEPAAYAPHVSEVSPATNGPVGETKAPKETAKPDSVAPADLARLRKEVRLLISDLNRSEAENNPMMVAHYKRLLDDKSAELAAMERAAAEGR